MNYINIIKLLEQFADKHYLVNRFHTDTLDRINNYVNKSEEYPLLYAVPVYQQLNTSENGYSYIQYIYDIYALTPRIEVYDNEEDEILTNQTNVNINHCITILTDLYHSLEALDQIDLGEDDVRIELVNNYTVDKLQGVYGRFTIEVDADKCEPLMERPLTIIEFDCGEKPDPEPTEEIYDIYFSTGVIEDPWRKIGEFDYLNPEDIKYTLVNDTFDLLFFQTDQPQDDYVVLYSQYDYPLYFGDDSITVLIQGLYYEVNGQGDTLWTQITLNPADGNPATGMINTWNGYFIYLSLYTYNNTFYKIDIYDDFGNFTQLDYFDINHGNVYYLNWWGQTSEVGVQYAYTVPYAFPFSNYDEDKGIYINDKYIARYEPNDIYIYYSGSSQIQFNKNNQIQLLNKVKPDPEPSDDCWVNGDNDWVLGDNDWILGECED